MADAYTKGDSLGIYETITDAGAGGFGGNKSIEFTAGLTGIVDTPHPQIVVSQLCGANGAGSGVLAADSDSTLTWAAPGEAAGDAVSIAAGETKLLESATGSKWARVYWDGDYSTDALGGLDTMALVRGYVDDLTLTGSAQDLYRVLILSNHSALSEDITALKAWVGTLGTQQTSDSAQLSGSGAGTLTTTGSFADWPESGWCHIQTSGGATREIVYYTARTATSLTVTANGRGMLGTSAAAGASDDTLDAVPGVRLAFEAADSDGRVQEIADAVTSPTGLTWDSGISSGTGLSHSTLAYRGNVGLWIHYDYPSDAVADPQQRTLINLEYTVGGATYQNQIDVLILLGDSGLVDWLVYAGEDADPDLDGAPDATESALPFTYALAAPVSGEREYRVTVRKRNRGGLVSKNTYTHKKVIDSGGNETTPEISDPDNVTLEEIGSGKLRLRAAYPLQIDSASPATHWRAYITTDGSTPDKSSTSPTSLTTIGTGSLTTGRAYLDHELGPYEWNTQVSLILEAYRTSDAAKSGDTTVYSATVDSAEPGQMFARAFGLGQYLDNYAGAARVDDEHSASPVVYSYAEPGLTWLDVAGAPIWRCVVSDDGGGVIHVDDALSFVDTTISGAGSGDVEVVSATEIYLCVGGTRRLKIDLSANTISAASFSFGATLDDNPNPTIIDTDNDKLYVQVFDPAGSRWRPFLQLDSSGNCAFAYDIAQDIS